MLQTLNPNEKIISYELIKTQPQKTLIASWESGLKTSFTSTGRSDGAISIVFEGTSMRKQLTFSDIFQAFKTSLQSFLDGIILKRDTSNKDFVRKSIEIVEAGCG